MWIDYVNSKSFGNIKTAVFYPYLDSVGKPIKYLPTDFLQDEQTKEFRRGEEWQVGWREAQDYYKNIEPLGISYLGYVDSKLSEEILNYNFKRINGEKFLKSLKSEEVDSSTWEIMHSDISENLPPQILDLAKIEDCMFPTYVEEDEEGPIDFSYFKGARINGKFIYLMQVPIGCGMIELYDKQIETPKESFVYKKFVKGISESKITNVPVAVIYLGPKYDIGNNSTELYWGFDPRGDLFYGMDKDWKQLYPYEYDTYFTKRLETLLDSTEYSKLLSETIHGGMLLLHVGQNSKLSINLSELSWLNTPNPNREQYKYSLTKKDYDNTQIKPTRKDKNYTTDRISGNILGTAEVEQKLPILTRKIKKISRTGTDGKTVYPYYSPNREYRHDQEINNNWVSNFNHNLGQFPGYSCGWTVKNKVIKALMTTVPVIPRIQSESGEWTTLISGVVSEPDNMIRVLGNTIYPVKILCDPGYEISDYSSAFSIYSKGTETILIPAKNENRGDLEDSTEDIVFKINNSDIKKEESKEEPEIIDLDEETAEDTPMGETTEEPTTEPTEEPVEEPEGIEPEEPVIKDRAGEYEFDTTNGILRLLISSYKLKGNSLYVKVEKRQTIPGLYINYNNKEYKISSEQEMLDGKVVCGGSNGEFLNGKSITLAEGINLNGILRLVRDSRLYSTKYSKNFIEQEVSDEYIQDGSKIIFKGVPSYIDYPEAKYCIYISDVICNIYVSGEDFEIDEYYSEVKYGESRKVRFYPLGDFEFTITDLTDNKYYKAEKEGDWYSFEIPNIISNHTILLEKAK